MLTKDMDMRIGERLAQVRKRRNLSQKELAAKAGLTYWAVSRIECGTRDPWFSTVQRLVRALDMPLSDFMAPIDTEPAERADTEALAS